MKPMPEIRPAFALSLVLLVAACAAPAPEVERQPPPPGEQLLEVPELEPPPVDEEIDAPVEQAASERSLRSGVLPGVEQQRDAEPPFEQRLQQRQQRVNLGLDQPQRERDPVDNLLDVEF